MIHGENELAVQVSQADIAHSQLESDFDAAQSAVEQRRQDREATHVPQGPVVGGASRFSPNASTHMIRR